MKPKALQPGDTIGIVAPSSPAEPEQIELALQIFANFGYRVKLGRSVNQRNGYLAGSDTLRAEDINRMFADPSVKAVFCLRGGYGATRMLDLIDYEIIRQNPKIFVGYSDITAIHLAIQKRTGLVTFHGPMVIELAKQSDSLSWSALFRHLTNPCPLGRYPGQREIFQYTVTGGTATGPLVGGNLSLLASTTGTPYEVETAGKILFIEEVGEEPYRLDRMLTQLRSAGKLQEANGILFTDCSDCEAEEEEKSLTIQEVLYDIIQPLGVPSYYGLKAGHCIPNLTLPIGVNARLNATEGWLEIAEGGVEPLIE
ncbi:LD-carboxypeptidase [Paenactinomyces guangxiensis]|uniref:LD-carboxypeptidase n=1 Tax=Paenactinomyces guangxiensis TaxID=1490290 RepID=A0A7W1WQR3_9BACL|nr:LD-carboxypeptidase [Paenactinomyces guangxiensis]MBA4494310.1 LD-carboxypeptidase [Paenactinomyces guangxiensis]MBH8590804.1 LD-carboxypeptidase [Paenactinomyces guangxiensis]